MITVDWICIVFCQKIVQSNTEPKDTYEMVKFVTLHQDKSDEIHFIMLI